TMQHLSNVLRSWLRKLLCTNRLKTFTNWPFVENCKCTPENVLYVHGLMLCLFSENIL
uniref:Uncharacterized protein n=1 Tax=Bubo bubo TaxID=30461 RepID=A0A8C0EW50_BUBBB